MEIMNFNLKQKDFPYQCKDHFSENEMADFQAVRLRQNTELPQVIRIGNAVLKDNASFPLLIPLRDSRGLTVIGDSADKDNICLFLQLTALRLLCGLSADVCQCRFVDLIRFGGIFPYISGLNEKIVQKDHLITDDRGLDRLLSDLSETAGMLIRNRLTYKFKNLADYNRNSGSLEPYHFIFIADFPAGFNRERIEKLSRIIQNSSKTGIYVFMTYDKNYSADTYASIQDENAQKLVWQMPLITDIDSISCKIKNIENIESLNGLFDLQLDGIHNSIARKIIENLILQLNMDSEETTEQELKEDGIRLPIGKKGHEVHYFTLGYDSNVYHALVGGQTGWGKTVLLHTIIVRVMEHYSPHELELWLMDYKEGTEFNIYQTHPNVTWLSVENSVEQGIEILEKLQSIISQRGELFKNENVGNITRYNEKTDKKLPRILLIIDEFQKLLENYKISTKVNTLLEDVAKRGRSFGIHLLLCTQSLKNSKLEETTRNQIGLRIVFKIHKSECGRFFDYNNDAPAYLDKKGEAVYNTDNGQPKANNRIMVDYIDESIIQGLIESGWSG